VAGCTDTPEFAVTNAEGKLIATFTIAADGEVISGNEVVADMITSMIRARNWTAAEAVGAFSNGWSNAYVSIASRRC
jgi:hypothetical protein